MIGSQKNPTEPSGSQLPLKGSLSNPKGQKTTVRKKKKTKRLQLGGKDWKPGKPEWKKTNAAEGRDKVALEEAKTHPENAGPKQRGPKMGECKDRRRTAWEKKKNNSKNTGRENHPYRNHRKGADCFTKKGET